MSGKKRGSAEIGERLDLEPKRVKYRDLESVFRSEGELCSLLICFGCIDIGEAR